METSSETFFEASLIKPKIHLQVNQLSWSLKHGVIFCLFFAAKSLQETSMRRMLWSNHHHSGPVFFDRYIFQCCIWYMSNLQHVIQILFRQPRKPLHHSKTYAHHVCGFLCHFIWAFVLCILIKFCPSPELISFFPWLVHFSQSTRYSALPGTLLYLAPLPRPVKS